MALEFIAAAFELAYGLIGLATIHLMTLIKGEFFRRSTAQEEKELAIERDQLWSLDKEPFPGLEHRFCFVQKDVRFHYVIREPANKTLSSNLVIFIHGFPDSWALWRHQLTSDKLRDATLIAIDLPGYGGSDGLDKFDAPTVLEAMTEFIGKLQDMYVSRVDGKNAPGQVILVSHDWGAGITFRLASEAPQLADRFIMSNCPHPIVIRANIIGRLKTTKHHLRTWMGNPLAVSHLVHAFATLRPIFAQLASSWYIFVFRLPMLLAAAAGTVGDFWFLRHIGAVAVDHPPPRLLGPAGAAALASMVGPSAEECRRTALPGEQHVRAYGTGIKARSGTGGWGTKIRLYRERLIDGPWTKSLAAADRLERLEAGRTGAPEGTASGLLNTGPAGAMVKPATVVWGMDDLALDARVCLEGMADYMVGEKSQVVQLHGVGHWTPVNEGGRDALVDVIAWALGDRRETLSATLTGKRGMEYVKVVVEK